MLVLFCVQFLQTNDNEFGLPGPSFAQTGDGIKWQEVIRKIRKTWGENVQFQHNRASNA
jgi:hypothetical protein